MNRPEAERLAMARAAVRAAYGAVTQAEQAPLPAGEPGPDMQMALSRVRALMSGPPDAAANAGPWWRRGLRRLLGRLFHFETFWQQQSNEAVLAVLDQLAGSMARQKLRLEVQHKALAAGAAHHEALEKYLQGNREQLAQLAGDCAAAGKDLAGITAALNEMEAEWRTGLESLQKEWSRGEARITEGNRARDSRMKALTDTATQALQRSEDVRQALVTAEHRLAELATLATRLQSVEDVQALEVADMDAMAFMERFRGSEDEIRRRLQPYVALFAEGSEPPPGPILDLGCGRGEFLELCRRQNIEAEGLEHDPELVRLLRSRGHTIHEKDALNGLRECDASSLGGIFSAQVIEHLPAGATIQLVKEAHRTLAPGGMLILETLNPASLAVLATTFYRDPGHRQPMHPETAGFILESAGFAEVRIVQHTPVPTEHALLAVTGREDDPVLAGVNRNVRILNHLLFGPQEYHVIGVRR